MEKVVQFPFDANEKFFRDFSDILQSNRIVRILPAYSNKTHKPTTQYRASMLESWKNANSFMPTNKKAGAKVLTPMNYDEIGEVYKCSIDEMLEIYSLPIFGESDGEEPEFYRSKT